MYSDFSARMPHPHHVAEIFPVAVFFHKVSRPRPTRSQEVHYTWRAGQLKTQGNPLHWSAGQLKPPDSSSNEAVDRLHKGTSLLLGRTMVIERRWVPVARIGNRIERARNHVERGPVWDARSAGSFASAMRLGWRNPEPWSLGRAAPRRLRAGEGDSLTCSGRSGSRRFRELACGVPRPAASSC